MGPNLGFVLTSLALANIATSTPLIYGTQATSAANLAQMTYKTDRQLIDAYGCMGRGGQNCSMADLSGSSGEEPIITPRILAAMECRGQSCLIADTSGSTGRIPTMKAEGASEADIRCIVKHNPDVGELLRKYYNKPPDVPKQDTGFISTMMMGLDAAQRPGVELSGSTEKGTFSGACNKNILIYAKGTFEPGEFGVFVGNSFTSGLGSDWTAVGVVYDVDVPGDFCLGLPGGMVVKDYINQAAQKCPNAQLFVAGYSQGAMAIRNGLARADDSAKARVKGVVTFGDPFNGAPIKGYNGPIAIYCNSGDGVCTGNFEVAMGHLSYGSDFSAGQAQRSLWAMARGWGDNSCCRPKALPPLPTPEEWAQTLKLNGGVSPKAVKGTSIEQWAQAISDSHGQIPKYSEGKALGRLFG